MTDRVTDDRAQVEQAFAEANVPTLIAVLFHLTGDETWLSPKYRTTRCRGMDVNDSGGLPEATQAEVRAAAVDAWTAWSRTGTLQLGRPLGEILSRMLDQVLGEFIPAEYEPMMAEILGVAESEQPHEKASADGGERPFHVLVVGAGVSGMLASYRLEQAGISHTVVEKNAEVGGSWWENKYPGAGVDTPSYLYSYSFHPWPWSTFFGKQREVERYLQDFAQTYEMAKRIRFSTEVTALEFQDLESTWVARVNGPDGPDVIHADAVISCVGFLNRPKIPDLPGIDSFEGTVFHSANWPEDLDLTGQDVVLIGAGASAMQIGPATAHLAKSMTILQRSPQWIAPNDDYFRRVPEGVHWLMENVPFYAGWYRARLNWVFNDRVHPTLKVDPDWTESARSVNATNDKHRSIYERYLRAELGDREDLVEKSLPGYPPFGKRMLLDNGWFKMLRRDNVRLVTEGAASLTAEGVVTSSGVHLPADVVILATGFHADRFLHPMNVVGSGGMSLTQLWGEHDGRAYLGMTVPGFPNLFLTAGPHTGLGHGGSYISVAEAQVRYVMELIETLRTGGFESVDCRVDINDTYNDRLDEAHAELVWTHPGMSNWYRNPGGRVVVVLPWRIVDYWSKTRHVDPDDFVWRRPLEAARR